MKLNSWNNGETLNWACVGMWQEQWVNNIYKEKEEKHIAHLDQAAMENQVKALASKPDSLSQCPMLTCWKF